MPNVQNQDRPSHAVFRPAKNRTELAFTQALPPGEPGLYLAIQADPRGALHLEARVRSRRGRNRMTNRRWSRVTLSSTDASHDAQQLVDILNRLSQARRPKSAFQRPPNAWECALEMDHRTQLAKAKQRGDNLKKQAEKANATAEYLRCQADQAEQLTQDATAVCIQRDHVHEAALNEAEQKADEAERALAAEQKRHHNAVGTSRRFRGRADKLEQHLAAAEQRAQIAESQLAELAWLRDRMNRLRPLIDRLPASIRNRLARFIPAFDATDPVGQDDLQAASPLDDRPLPVDVLHNLRKAPQVPRTTASEDAGERFLAWLQRSIADDVVPINQYDNTIHVLPERLALLSPAIFREFDAANCSHVQKRFQKLKLHAKTPQDTNIWTCQAEGKRTALFKIFLIPNAEDVLGTTLPAPNRWLTLLGQEDKTSCA